MNEKKFLRAHIEEHLFKAIKYKALVDGTSMAAAVNSILANYFVSNQQYLKIVRPEIIIQEIQPMAFEDDGEEIWKITGGWVEEK